MRWPIMAGRIRRSLGAIGLVIGALVLAGSASAGSLESRSLPAGPYPGSRERIYRVFVPDDLPADGGAPVVMLLHGCLQDERDMIEDTRFTELAERDGFIVVFPFVTSYPFLPLRARNCWGFFVEGQRQEGRGEAADLRRIFGAVEEEFRADPARRYVAGLSSGGAMAVVMAVAYSEDIAAAGAVAGVPYGEDACAVAHACFTGVRHRPVAALREAMRAEQQAEEDQRLVPLMVIHSTNDGTVPIKNALNLRDAWIAHHAPDATLAGTGDCTTDGVPCEHSRFVDRAGRTVVETVFYDGPRFGRTHFWVGDHEGRFADPDGPSASELLWDFFRQHRLAPD